LGFEAKDLRPSSSQHKWRGNEDAGLVARTAKILTASRVVPVREYTDPIDY